LPRLPRLTPADAETLLFDAGFSLIRTKGSHHIYQKGTIRVVVPFHAGKILHPKITKQIFSSIASCLDEQK
jgi:predicted RNA binding protein YcfA (HicA-like mRNA interferase family)